MALVITLISVNMLRQIGYAYCTRHHKSLSSQCGKYPGTKLRKHSQIRQ